MEREDFTTQYLTLVDRYMSIYKNDLIPSIKNGHFGMAATKLNMGAEYLETYNIPSELKSKIHLDAETLEVIDFEDVSSHFKPEKSKDDETELSTTLRNRKSKKDDKKEEEETTEDSKSKIEAAVEENLKTKNPIYWYGTVRLSEDLVDAQSHFVEAVKSILELGKIVKELNELDKRKNQVLSSGQ